MIKIYKKIEKIWFKIDQKIRFVLVGGFNTLFALFLFGFFTLYIHINYKQSLIIQYIISTNISIFTMRYFVFDTSFVFNRYVKAWGIYLFMLAFNYFCLFFLVEVCALMPFFSQFLYTIISAIVLYILHKKIVFSNY